MPEIIKPLTFDDLPIKPPLIGRPKISDDLQQTAALLVGWDKATRRLVSVSPTGVLHIAQSPVKGIINAQAAADGITGQGDDISTSEVMVKAKPSNVGTFWINIGAAAGDNVGFPLDAGEHFVFSVNNLHSVHYYFSTKDDWGIVVYTK